MEKTKNIRVADYGHLNRLLSLFFAVSAIVLLILSSHPLTLWCGYRGLC